MKAEQPSSLALIVLEHDVQALRLRALLLLAASVVLNIVSLALGPWLENTFPQWDILPSIWLECAALAASIGCIAWFARIRGWRLAWAGLAMAYTGAWPFIFSAYVARTLSLWTPAPPLWLRGDVFFIASFAMPSVLLAPAMRSWRVLVASGLAACAAGLLASEQHIDLPQALLCVVYAVWHAATVGIFLCWAYAHACGRLMNEPWACWSCGYDLSGIPAGPCPECGAQ